MADYQAMYTVLFGKVADVIEELQKTQRQTEEMYISDESSDDKVFYTGKTKEKTFDMDME